jgi:catalase
MAMRNPPGRANYEPNSWGGAAGGPREAPDLGFQSYPAEEEGQKRRIRAELFADHYSQARQFYLSQTAVEQTHIKDAFVFELSKVETPAIRARMVAHLLNVDDALAQQVADGLGLSPLPKPAEPARPVVTDLEPSNALSIIRNGPESFKGRKLGILVTDGTDAALLEALQQAVKAEGGTVELVAPKIGGIKTSDGKERPVGQKVNGGPSVLYDAVALLPSAEGAAVLAKEAAAKDFVNDAYAHAKFIAYAEAARPLFEKAGIDPDEGFALLKTAADARRFLALCKPMRYWAREAEVHADS